MTITTDPLATAGGQFPLQGSAFDPVPTDVPSESRPFGLRHAELVRTGTAVPLRNYDGAQQKALGTGGPVPGDPTAHKTFVKDGEDGPSSTDWIND